MGEKLTEGSIEIIMNGGCYENPVMQILGSKKIHRNSPEDRYRLFLSDGKHMVAQALLATQLNDKLIAGEFSDYTVIRINKLMTSLMKNKDVRERDIRVLVILDATVITPGSVVGRKLGEPQQWTADLASKPSQNHAPQMNSSVVPQTNYVPSVSDSKSSVNVGFDSSMLSTQMTLPIAHLSPYQNKWVIKVRVMNKSQIRTWSNSKGEGKLFSMDLCDESGEIRATAFKNECDKFYDMMQVDKVYYISRCTLKTANKQFTNLKNDYEMTFTPDTVVAECMDETASTVPSLQYDFVPISQIAEKPPNTIIDLIGVCKMASDVQELTAKSSGKLLKKREITLMDSTGSAVGLTLWANEAETFDGSNHPVVAVKGGRVTEFNGSKSVSCVNSTMLRLDPELPEAYRLRGWYDQGGADTPLVNISARTGSGTGGNWLSLAEAEGLGGGERGDFYSALAVVTHVNTDNVVYKACSQEQCNKKLVDQENGLFRCEKCNREYPNYKYRMLLSAVVADATGDQRVTAFNEAAEAMLHATAASVGDAFDHDKAAYVKLFDDIKFKSYVFRFRTKMETYNDEARLKTIVMNATPVDYKEANTRFIKNIETLTGVKV